MPHTPKPSNARVQQIHTRNEYARRILAGFRVVMPTLSDAWQYLEDALNDAPAIVAELTRLSAELDQMRLDRANLHAAMRAAVHAEADGEPDPLWYVRDELAALQAVADASQSLPDAPGRHE